MSKMSAELTGVKTFYNLTDVHVHARGANESYKGDIDTETQAALAGGFTEILVMPNTNPPLVDEETLKVKVYQAERRANCMVGLYAAGTQLNSENVYKISERVCGLKIYMNNTTGELKITDSIALENQFKNWSGIGPICVHAEEEFGSLSTALVLASKYKRHLHVCHVSSKEEIELITKAKEANLPVTCEVAPHHLLFTEDDQKKYLGNYGIVKPRLKTNEDVNSLWEAIRSGVIDVIADDHAPHTRGEKESSNPPSGIPGLETTIPLMFTAVNERRISFERLIQMLTVNPAKIFHLPQSIDTYTVFDLNKTYYLDESELKTKCGYSPFKDHLLTGKVRAVFIKGQMVYKDGEVLPYKNREELVIKKYE